MPKHKEIAIITSSGAQWLPIPIERAIQKAGGKPLSLNPSTDSAVASGALRDIITRCTAIVADFTTYSPDVMFAVGLAQGLGKPIIPLAVSFLDIPTTLQSIQFMLLGEFPNEEDFSDRLAAILSDVLKTPDKYSYESALEFRSKKQRIFVSYSHSDKEYVERLLVHLRPLQKQGMLELWVDTHLRAGDNWKNEIQKALERATAAILIISADFLASDFIVDNELPPLLRNAEEKGTRILPLIAKPCRFTRDPNLKHFQSINDPKEALVLLDSGHQEKILDALCAEVERYINKG